MTMIEKDREKDGSHPFAILCVCVLTHWAYALVQYFSLYLFFFNSVSLSLSVARSLNLLILEFMIYTHINFKWTRKLVLYSICWEDDREKETGKKRRCTALPQNNLHKWKRFQIVTLTLTVFGETFTKYFGRLLFYLC